MQIDMERVRRLVELDTAIAATTTALDDLKFERATLEADLLPAFEQAGVTSVRAGRTVFIRRDLWAAPPKADNGQPDYATLNEGLRAAGPEWSYLIEERVNVQSLSARVRELDRDESTLLPVLPPELVGKVSLTEKFSLRTRAR